MLEENHAELQGVLRDVFEDAVLMGVDEAAMRRVLMEMIDQLAMPGPAAADGSGSG